VPDVLRALVTFDVEPLDATGRVVAVSAALSVAEGDSHPTGAKPLLLGVIDLDVEDEPS